MASFTFKSSQRAKYMIMHPALQQAMFKFGGWLAGYTLATFFTVTLFNNHLVPDLLRIPAALIPMLPAIFALLSWVEGFRVMDELQQKIQTEAIAFGFGLTAVLTFSYGWLQLLAEFPSISWFAM